MQLLDPVGYGGNVPVDGVIERPGGAPEVEGELDTLVTHLARIDDGRGYIAGDRGQRDRQQNVGCLLDEIVRREIELVAQQPEVHSNVVLGSGLPFQVRVSVA